MRVFVILWLGQVVSLVGSGMTRFAMGVWVYQNTGSATLFGVTQVAAVIPNLIVLPFAGALVDRWNRRGVMILADCAAAAITLVLGVLLWQKQLAFWHVCVANALISAVAALQVPAWLALTGTIVPHQRLARANGLLEAGSAGARVVAPLIAGVVIGVFGIPAIILADGLTFFIAVASLMVVHVPVHRGISSRPRPVLQEIAAGWQYLVQMPGIKPFVAYFAVLNMCLNMAWVLMTPLVLGFASADVLGTIMAVAGCGMVLGGIVLTLWGGPAQKLLGTLGGGLVFGVCLMIAGMRNSAALLGAAAFGMYLTLPIINGCFRAVWQERMPKDLHGRVAANLQLMVRWTLPVGFAIAGPLADHVFEPLLLPGGALAGTVGRVVGTGAGRGTGLLFVMLGALAVLATAAVYRLRNVRSTEVDLAAAQRDPAGITPAPSG